MESVRTSNQIDKKKSTFIHLYSTFSFL